MKKIILILIYLVAILNAKSQQQRTASFFRTGGYQFEVSLISETCTEEGLCEAVIRLTSMRALSSQTNVEFQNFEIQNASSTGLQDITRTLFLVQQKLKVFYNQNVIPVVRLQTNIPTDGEDGLMPYISILWRPGINGDSAPSLNEDTPVSSSLVSDIIQELVAVNKIFNTQSIEINNNNDTFLNPGSYVSGPLGSEENIIFGNTYYVGGSPFNVVETRFVRTLNLELEDEDTLTVYPNPMKDILYLSLGKNGNLVFEILDLQGRNLEKQKIRFSFRSSYFKMNVSHLKSGTYILKITTGNRTLRKKIIKF